MNESVDSKKQANLKDVLRLLKFINEKKRVTISDINDLPKYKKYVSALSVKDQNNNSNLKIKARNRIREIDLQLLLDNNLIEKFDSDYISKDYPKEKLTNLQKELSKLYAITLNPQERHILFTITSESMLDRALLYHYDDFKKHFESLVAKKEMYGYKEIGDYKFAELCRIGAILHNSELTDTTIKDIIYRLNYESDSKHIKELKDFITKKNPSAIFLNKWLVIYDYTPYTSYTFIKAINHNININ